MICSKACGVPVHCVPAIATSCLQRCPRFCCLVPSQIHCSTGLTTTNRNILGKMLQFKRVERCTCRTAALKECPRAISRVPCRRTTFSPFRPAMAPAAASSLNFARRPLVKLDAAKRVPSTEAAVLLDSGFRYLDVRTPEEYAEGHAVGAINIPFLFKTADGQMVPNPDFLQQVQEQFPDANEQVIVGCRSGNRSARACALLEQQAQYSNLIDDAGGWLGWVEAKLPVEL